VALWIVRWTSLFISSASFRTQPVGNLLAQSRSIFWSTGLMLFGGATLAFAILEWIQRRRPFLENWDPRSLARVRDTRRIKRSGSITEFAVQIAFALWWIHPQAFFRLESAGKTWSAGPTWSHLHGVFFLPVLLISLATAALACVDFLRPHASRLRVGIRAGAHLAAAAIALIVLTAHWPGFRAELELLRSGSRPSSAVMAATMVTDVFVYLNLLGIALGVAVAFVVEVVRMVRMGQDGAGLQRKSAEMVVGIIATSR
jgi:hypothetical protein